MSEQEHDPAADRWARQAPQEDDAMPPTRAEALRIRKILAAEQRGEYDAEGNFRPSSWGPA
jgi:hypothetical protein